MYFEDPNGHLLEVITRPYGSGEWTREDTSDFWAGSPRVSRDARLVRGRQNLLFERRTA